MEELSTSALNVTAVSSATAAASASFVSASLALSLQLVNATKAAKAVIFKNFVFMSVFFLN
jgi:hypothetical protein